MDLPSLFRSEAPWTAGVALLSDLLPAQPDKPEETPETTLLALWHTAAGVPRSAVSATYPPPPLESGQRSRLAELVERRLSGTPLAHLTGLQHFMGGDFLAGPEALIPRRETELLAEAALQRLDQLAAHRASPTVVDLCTGCGNIALTLARACPTSTVWATDLSAEAVELARRNTDHLRLTGRVQFRTGDLFAAIEDLGLRGDVDLITCNPPYVPSSRVGTLPAEISSYEPPQAFDGGALGLNLILRLFTTAAEFLRPGSWLQFEVGRGQGEFILNRIRKSGLYAEVRALTDPASGAVRCIEARSPA